MMSTTHRLLAPVEAAALACLSTRQLLRLARRDQVPHVVLPGDEIRFDVNDLREWIETQKRPAEIEDAADPVPLLLDAKALAVLMSTSSTTIWRWDASGKLPRPLRISRGTTRWRRNEIEQWIALDCPDRRTFENLVNANGQPICK